MRLWNQFGIFLPLSVFDVSSCTWLRSPVVCNPSSAPDDRQLFLFFKEIFWSRSVRVRDRLGLCLSFLPLSSLCTRNLSTLGAKTTDPSWGETGIGPENWGRCLHSWTGVGLTWFERWRHWGQSHYTALADNVQVLNSGSVVKSVS